MNQYLTQIEIENMDDTELLKTYRELFNLIAQKETEVQNLHSLYCTIKSIEKELFRRS